MPTPRSPRSPRRALLVLALTLLTGGISAQTAAASDLTLSYGGETDFEYNYDNTLTVTPKNVGEINDGPPTVTIALPAGVTATAAVGQTGAEYDAGWVCSLGSTVTCVADDYGYDTGESYQPIVLTLRVDANAGPTASITSTVTSSDDTNPANNAITGSFPIGYLDDVAVATSHLDPWSIGPREAIKLTITNTGHEDTDGQITLVDTLPANFAVTGFGSATNWSCSANGGVAGCTRTRGMRAGSSDVLYVYGTIGAPAAGATLTDTANITYTGDENAANNSSSASSGVAFVNDLSVGITPVALQAHIGSALTFTVVQNGRNPTTAATTLTIAVPGTVAVGSAIGQGWVCTPGAPISCTYAGKVKGAFPPVTLPVTPGSGTAPSQTFTATVRSVGDQNAANDSVPVVVPVTEQCVVPVVKGMTLKQARNALEGNSCRVGRVKVGRKPKALARFKTKKVVVKASRRKHSTAVAGAKVGLTLKYVRKR